ncbi:hypothetical protein FIBSPDRAFT_1051175 [Athelia psychrophila]|uniref:CFEM domain-containing protein n=1 Tax=Athelia psychrophila TaxID=1759441 RepID=A0A165ZK80_9AGAM|nr:hypothetical protein FIBSPDRAFT_1051175 [Fibularhizoctonia sp. CBS 109695]
MKYFSPSLALSLCILQLSLAGSAWATNEKRSPTLIPPTVSVTNLSTAGQASSTGSTSANQSTAATSTSTAQYPSLSGVPACVTNCLDSAVSTANCSSVVDVNCFCKQGKFPDAIVSCISVTCPSELASAEQLSQQFCNIASASPSLSFPKASITSTSSTLSGTPSVTSSSKSSSSGSNSTASTSTGGSATSSATQTGAAMTPRREGSGGAVAMAMGVGLLGVAMGALAL